MPGIRRLLVRKGLGDEGEDADGAARDPWADAEPLLAGVAAASVQGRVALGPRAGRAIRRRGASAAEATERRLGACHARQDGFDLRAAVRIPVGHRDRLERICRYTLRPPVATDRLRLTDDGQVLLELPRRWADGTTQLLFDPVELLERLAAITPRPRINLVLCDGVLGARAAWRPTIVPRPRPAPAPDAEDEAPRRARPGWADLMRRTFGFDVMACPRCGGRLRLLALIEAPRVIRRILTHLGLPTDVPEPRPARDPPVRSLGASSPSADHGAPFDVGGQQHAACFAATPVVRLHAGHRLLEAPGIRWQNRPAAHRRRVRAGARSPGPRGRSRPGAPGPSGHRGTRPSAMTASSSGSRSASSS